MNAFLYLQDRASIYLLLVGILCDVFDVLIVFHKICPSWRKGYVLDFGISVAAFVAKVRILGGCKPIQVAMRIVSVVAGV